MSSRKLNRMDGTRKAARDDRIRGLAVISICDSDDVEKSVDCIVYNTVCASGAWCRDRILIWHRLLRLRYRSLRRNM